VNRFLFFTLILSLTVALVFLGPPFSSLVSLNYSEYGKQEIASSNDGIEYDRMNPPIRKPMPIRYRPLLPPASPTP
jgi:hypothetical protein